ncbi:recombinase family protein [Bacillus subtilis]|uniref:site-specific DNA recombinase SpoIVCA n=1 Tax=Bacillus subtilis TaxID=1423 RepID=UPI000BA67339|nr:site-specific DNA recombinase SpoIVCA [Bacillus subtilis]PAC85923.1 recombinase family protein [Bacillus subtilis]PAE61584.1 recombinase family protein [Bacillus subtilis]QFP71468.1 recombinase family protein [Bacillus subtilis]QGM16390.1 recombinase family protein [Bacillus subtilis]
MIAIYVRVSTEEQAIKGSSIDSQIEACIKKAGTKDVLKYADEGFSGELLERPALNRLREDASKGLISQVICYDPDRLSRKLMNQLIIDDELRKRNIPLIFVNGEYANSPEGQLFFAMRGAISEFEKAKIKERTSSGRLQKMKKGMIIKDSKLYGYKFVKEKRTLEIFEEEAKIIRMIFNYFTDHKSPFFGRVNGIALHLTQMGVKTKKGAKVWHRQVVRQILMNSSYKGEHKQYKYDTEGSYVSKQAGNKSIIKIRPEEEQITVVIPAIVPAEQWEYAQELLGQSKRKHLSISPHNYLLSGLVRCGKCGNTMTGKKRKSHGKDYYVYTCRKNYSGAKDRGCGKEMSENKLNRHVWGEIFKFITNPQKYASFKEIEQSNHLSDELELIQKEIEKTKKGRKRLLTLISLSDDDDLDIDEIKAQIIELQKKQNQLTEKCNEIQSKMKVLDDTSSSENALKRAIDYFQSIGADNLTLEDKKTIVNFIVKEVTVVDSDTVYIETY